MRGVNTLNHQGEQGKSQAVPTLLETPLKNPYLRSCQPPQLGWQRGGLTQEMPPSDSSFSCGSKQYIICKFNKRGKFWTQVVPNFRYVILFATTRNKGGRGVTPQVNPPRCRPSDGCWLLLLSAAIQRFCHRESVSEIVEQQLVCSLDISTKLSPKPKVWTEKKSEISFSNKQLGKYY